jgi:hypothetical protein
VQSLEIAVARYTYYERQLGTKDDKIAQAIPKLAELDTDSLQRMRLAAQEPTMEPRVVEVDIAQDFGRSGGHPMSSYEADEMAKPPLATQRESSIGSTGCGHTNTEFGVCASQASNSASSGSASTGWV